MKKAKIYSAEALHNMMRSENIAPTPAAIKMYIKKKKLLCVRDSQDGKKVPKYIQVIEV